MSGWAPHSWQIQIVPLAVPDSRPASILDFCVCLVSIADVDTFPLLPASSQPRQPPPLHLSEGSGPAQTRYDAHHQQYGECLEQIPAGVVHEEDGFDTEDRPVEEGV
jgi:hypothetical protein